MARYEHGEILPPTPEDALIFQRNWQRMGRWASMQRDSKLAMRALRNWCGDYLHRKQ